jgi:hypothetical protein
VGMVAAPVADLVTLNSVRKVAPPEGMLAGLATAHPVEVVSVWLAGTGVNAGVPIGVQSHAARVAATACDDCARRNQACLPAGPSREQHTSPGLSFGLIHPVRHRSPAAGALIVFAQARTLADAGAQYSKACEGASLPWVQTPPPPPLTCTNTGPSGRQAHASCRPSLIYWSQLRVAEGHTVGISYGCCAWSQRPRTGLNADERRCARPRGVRPDVQGWPGRSATGPRPHQPTDRIIACAPVIGGFSISWTPTGGRRPASARRGEEWATLDRDPADEGPFPLIAGRRTVRSQ